MHKNNIVLVGYMGCGKSTIARELLYGRPVSPIDTDVEIEKRKGMTIAEIFEKEGEMSFRDEETMFLQELLEKDMQDAVLSTGGGMPLREENRKLLKKFGFVVYLKASPEETLERLKDDTSRPLLKAPDRLERIKSMIAQRQQVYEETADLTILVDGKSPTQIVEEIRKEMA